ncbi:MAG: hypothetical protein WC341_00585 [Bacteroidales bacterium]|jgi:23S rRNA U2552 (ribose-2'-O)-methylase RlmE/FtsJ
MTCQCGVCGKFAVIVDSYTEFGGSQDVDPPEEVPMCQKCVDKDIEYYRKNHTMPCHWIKGKYEENLAKELGYFWSVLPGCAWGTWKRIQSIGEN